MQHNIFVSEQMELLTSSEFIYADGYIDTKFSFILTVLCAPYVGRSCCSCVTSALSCALSS